MASQVLTNIGEEWVVDRLVGSGGTYSAAPGSFCHWGTGTGAASKTDTGLFTVSNDPASTNITTGTVSKSGSGSAAKWQCVSTVASTTTQTITNAGIFGNSNLSTNSYIFIHADFTGIALVNGDSIQFTWTLDPA
jgi:hypothetical protein